MEKCNKKQIKRIYFTDNTKSMLYSLLLTTIISGIGKLLININKNIGIWDVICNTIDIEYVYYLLECVALNLIIWSVSGIVSLFAENTKRKKGQSQVFLGVFLIYIIVYLIGFFVSIDLVWLIFCSIITVVMGCTIIWFFSVEDEMEDNTYSSDGSITG